MKVLVIGSGGREHALVWKLAQSKRVSKIYCAPGNAGIESLAECVDIKPEDISSLCRFAKVNNIDLTIVGPEMPLALGIVELFRTEGLLIFGPTKEAARIESSKSFAKELMSKYRIPTAKYKIFQERSDAKQFARSAKYPLVVKFDGLAGGKGVFICEKFEQAQKAIDNCFTSSHKAVIIEEYLQGRELTFQVITDGYTAIPLPSSQDYKKSQDGNAGLNTGGMGSISPVPFLDEAMEHKIMTTIIMPVLEAMDNEGHPFSGTLYAGLMIDKHNNPYVIEFNCRFGDPETQAILPLLEEDLFDILYSTATGALSDEYEYFHISKNHSVNIVLVSSGYPRSFKKGFVINGLDEIEDDNVNVFHAGTAFSEQGEYITDGGRVLCINGVALNLARAHEHAYETVKFINFKNLKYRKDIAKFYIKK